MGLAEHFITFSKQVNNKEQECLIDSIHQMT